MATRPIFSPSPDTHLVQEKSFDFPWAPGFSATQKKKNIQALHTAARQNGIQNILEISSKSLEKLGRKLSAFSLKIAIDGQTFPLESVYQGAKVFANIPSPTSNIAEPPPSSPGPSPAEEPPENTGPFPEIFHLSPTEAKRFIRAKTSDGANKLIRFELSGKPYPLSPKNAFYDWLYIRALKDHADWIRRNVHYEAFTDIEFNPAKQVNCQARAFAEYLTLLRQNKLTEAANDFTTFAKMINSA
ncbi:MAG: hypothetical protein GDA55_08560 [Cellvibrionales bacterium]|nr:hypothetical protein [Cellvibrionales bacterium]